MIRVSYINHRRVVLHLFQDLHVFIEKCILVFEALGKHQVAFGVDALLLGVEFEVLDLNL